MKKSVITLACYFLWSLAMGQSNDRLPVHFIGNTPVELQPLMVQEADLGADRSANYDLAALNRSVKSVSGEQERMACDDIFENFDANSTFWLPTFDPAFPSTPLFEPPTCGPVYISPSNVLFSGDLILFTVEPGNTYIWTTCGLAGFDTYIRIWDDDAVNGFPLLAENDDDFSCPSSIFHSTLTWVNTTGATKVWLGVSEFPCQLSRKPYDILTTCIQGNDPCAGLGGDTDGDGVCDADDNCPTVSNPDQLDGDSDGIGEICDACPKDPDNDIDGDGFCVDVDNCPTDANPDQTDSDLDGDGDVCDICPFDPDNDKDQDGFCADVDNCPEDANPGQLDSDCDGVGDACDVCEGGDDSVDESGPDGIPDGIADCSQLLDYDEYTEEWKCANNKILVCHNASNKKSICVNKNSLASHFAHGDQVGPCTSCEDEGLDRVIHSFDLIKSLEVAPNPASDNLIVRVGLSGETGELMIFNTNGVTVWKASLTKGDQEINIDISGDDFSSGVYMVRASVGLEHVARRVVIMK